MIFIILTSQCISKNKSLFALYPNYTNAGLSLKCTDLNSSGKPIDLRGDPSLSLYFCPVAVLRINPINTPLHHRLEQVGKANQRTQG